MLFKTLPKIRYYHDVVSATFGDNKIRSAELTSESDQLIHILYGVLSSWIYKNLL